MAGHRWNSSFENALRFGGRLSHSEIQAAPPNYLDALGERSHFGAVILDWSDVLSRAIASATALKCYLYRRSTHCRRVLHRIISTYGHYNSLPRTGSRSRGNMATLR